MAVGACGEFYAGKWCDLIHILLAAEWRVGKLAVGEP